MTSTIETELLRITKLKPARVESRAQLLTRLWDAAHSLSDRDWDKLSAPAATWVNDITHQNKLWKAKKPNGEFIPDEFPDLVQAAEEPVDEPEEAPKPKAKAGPKPKPEPEEAPEEEDEEEPTDELPESKPEEDGDEEVLQTRGAKPKPQEVEETGEDEPEEEVAASEPEDEELAEEAPEEEPEPVQARARSAPKPVPAKLMERAPKIAPKPVPKEPAPKATPKKPAQPEYERPATNVQGMVRLKIIENPGIETAALQQEIEDAFGTKVSTETVRSSRSWFKAALRDLNHAGCLSKKFQAELIAAGALRKGS